MKVAFLSMYNGSVNRGIESWTLQICRELSKIGVDCLLIQGGTKCTADRSFQTTSVGCDFPDRTASREWADLVLSKYELHTTGREKVVFATKSFAPLKRFAPDVIFPVTSGPAVVGMVQFYKRNWNRSAVTIVRTPGGYNRNIQRAIRLGIDGISTSEPYCLEQIKKDYEITGTVIPPGIDIDKFKTAQSREVSLPGPIVITTSNLQPYKRIDLAVRAVAQTRMSLLVVGDGPERQTICSLGAELLGSARFRWLPEVPFDDIPSYYMAADVFTLPSDHTESFGSVILEANAAGLNAVVTDDKIRRWMLADSGHFVDPRDSDCYAAALLEAAASKSSESALQNLKRFEWSAIAPQWLGFFNQIIEQSRTRQNSNKN